MTGKINYLNWPDQFPYKPEVVFELKAKPDRLLLSFKVREELTIARASHNFDNVWQDSCCELFIQFEGEDNYYNLETSCNGYQLLAYRPGREGAQPAPAEILDKVICRTSLEKHARFEAKHIDEWSLEIEIPVEVFWRSGIKDLTKVKAKGNIYKCVESLEQMHFISWAPIPTENPDFHRPEYFKDFIL